MDLIPRKQVPTLLGSQISKIQFPLALSNYSDNLADPDQLSGGGWFIFYPQSSWKPNRPFTCFTSTASNTLPYHFRLRYSHPRIFVLLSPGFEAQSNRTITQRQSNAPTVQYLFCAENEALTGSPETHSTTPAAANEHDAFQLPCALKPKFPLASA